MKVYKAPCPLPSIQDRLSVFLAGGTEMGVAETWRAFIMGLLEQYKVLMFDPWRDDWDSSWEQSIDNLQFREQVEWELDALKTADLIALYLSPGTKSSISLLELGLYAASGKLVVCCPEGFWRKGNVDIVCAAYDIKQVASLADLASVIRFRAQEHSA